MRQVPVTQTKSLRPGSHSQYPSIHSAIVLGGSIPGFSLIGAGGVLSVRTGSRSLRGERNASWSGPSISGFTAGSGAGFGFGFVAPYPAAPCGPPSPAGSAERPVDGGPPASCPKAPTGRKPAATSTTPSPIRWMRFIATDSACLARGTRGERRPMARVRTRAIEGTDRNRRGPRGFIAWIGGSGNRTSRPSPNGPSSSL